MLKSLNYRVVFSTGLQKQGSFQYPLGLIVVSGENEAGKSLSLEMLRYALWGTKALRSVLTDYEEIQADLEFEVRGQAYKVSRSKKNTLVYAGDDVVAKGAEGAASFLRGIFGYGIEVFDATNACLQGQLGRFTEAPAAERKNLVDQVTGINRLDTIITWAQSKVKETQAVLRSLVALPLPPLGEPPVWAPFEGHTTPWTLGEVEADRRAWGERAQQQSQLLREEQAWPAAPARPVPPPGYMQTAGFDLGAYTAHRDHLIEAQRVLDNYPVITEEQERDNQRKITERQFVKPQYTQEYLDEQRRLIHLASQKEEVLTCPACQHQFTRSGAGVVKAPPPSMSLAEVNRQQSLITLWETNPYKDLTPLGGDIIPPHLINWGAERRRVVQQLPAGATCFSIPPDMAPAYWASVAHDQLMKAYQDYKPFPAEKQQAIQRDFSVQYQQQSLVWAYMEDYQRFVAQYSQTKKQWDDRTKQVQELEETAENYQRVVKSMKDLKVQVKSYLVPSLSRVASVIMQAMTDGMHQEIKVSEDFEILVDGAKLATLSGSAKNVVDLAVRLGLGQVLTNGVFSVFLADEIDHAMSDKRAEATAKTLQNLTKVVKQILLVSHRLGQGSPDETNHIHIGD